MPDLVAIPGGVEARIDAAERYLRGVGEAPVVVAHDAGLLVGVALARRVTLRALVLVAPLIPRSDRTHALLWSWPLVWSLIARRGVAPPSGVVAEVLFDDLPGPGRAALKAEDPRVITRLLLHEGLGEGGRLTDVPVLVIRGDGDAALAADEAEHLALRLGGRLETIPGGHWLLGGRAWLECAGVVHRWVVRSLGEPLLELHAEAMADRDGDDDVDA